MSQASCGDRGAVNYSAGTYWVPAFWGTLFAGAVPVAVNTTNNCTPGLSAICQQTSGATYAYTPHVGVRLHGPSALAQQPRPKAFPQDPDCGLGPPQLPTGTYPPRQCIRIPDILEGLGLAFAGTDLAYAHP